MPHLERRLAIKKQFVSREIKRQRKKGKSQNQAEDIAFSRARKRFGDRSLRRRSR